MCRCCWNRELGLLAPPELGTEQEAETGNAAPQQPSPERAGVSQRCWCSAVPPGREALLLLGSEKREGARGSRWQLWERRARGPSSEAVLCCLGEGLACCCAALEVLA